MAIRNYLRAFNGGEVSPSMYARIDDGKYQTGMAQCKNFLIEPQGAVANRPGFKYVNATKYADRAARLIPFVFSLDQTMVLEFGHYYIRFHTNGQTLMGNNGQPYEIATPYRDTDVFDIHYVQSADVMTLVHPSYPPKELRRYGATDWRLVDIVIRSSLTPPGAPSVTQTINNKVENPQDYVREYAVTALDADGKNESERGASTSIRCNPYGDGAYNTISWGAVSGAVRYRVYRNQGGVWAFIGETTSTSINDENISPDGSITPPIYDDVFKQQRGITSARIVNGGYGYFGRSRVTKVYSYGKWRPCTWNEKGEWMNLQLPFSTGMDSNSEHGAYQTGTFSYLGIFDQEGGGTGAVGRMSTQPYGRWGTQIYDAKILEGGSGYVHPVMKFQFTSGTNNVVVAEGYLECQAETEPVEVEVYDAGGTGYGAEVSVNIQNGVFTEIHILSPGYNYTNPQLRIKAANGSGAIIQLDVGLSGDYPGAVSYFEQRRWFGGTLNRPNSLWATRPGTESDMSYSLPSKDDDRISVRVAAREANRILHIVPLAHLMLLTGASEWRVSPLNSDAITPTSMSVRPQSYVGSSNVQPLVIASSMLYAASRGGHLRELGYNYEAGGYISGDVCLRAPHLFDNKNIVDLAYSKSPWPIVWAVSSSGKLISLTYVPEQQVGAFSTVETEGWFESVAVVAEGDEDILYAEVKRYMNGRIVRTIERMHERQYEDVKECVYLDCAGTYIGEPKTEISGITWLEGVTVGILADGGVEPEQKVVNGKITLTHPASIVQVGIPYVSDLKTLPAAMALQDGSYGSGHKKNVREVFFRVVNSSGTQAGPSFDKLAEYPARSTEFAGSAPDPITDEVGFQIQPQWSQGGQVCVRQKYPLPLRIVSMTTVLELS